jgi:hypothetical protein
MSAEMKRRILVTVGIYEAAILGLLFGVWIGRW